MKSISYIYIRVPFAAGMMPLFTSMGKDCEVYETFTVVSGWFGFFASNRLHLVNMDLFLLFKAGESSALVHCWSKAVIYNMQTKKNKKTVGWAW